MIEAGHGRAALELVTEAPPGLILLDLMMPEMDGFEFLSEFRKIEEWRAIPVMAVTARDPTAQDRLRPNGYMAQIVQKQVCGRNALLAEVRNLVAAGALWGAQGRRT